MSAYWQQWDKSELDAMHGIEHDNDAYDDFDYDEEEGCQEGECPCFCCSVNPCGRCMDCLGMSWRDFM